MPRPLASFRARGLLFSKGRRCGGVASFILAADARKGPAGRLQSRSTLSPPSSKCASSRGSVSSPSISHDIVSFPVHIFLFHVKRPVPPAFAGGTGRWIKRAGKGELEGGTPLALGEGSSLQNKSLMASTAAPSQKAKLQITRAAARTGGCRPAPCDPPGHPVP